MPRSYLLALAAGIASATGFAPLQLWPVTLVMLALLLWLTFRAGTLKQALLTGWLFGVGHFVLGNNWIQHAFDFQEKMPPALGYVAVIVLALYLAIYPMLAMGLAWRWKQAHPTRIPGADFALVAGAAWTVTEWLRAVMFTGYSWNPIGVIWLPVPGIAQSAAWYGTYALSGLTLVMAGALLLLFHRRWRFAAATGAAAVLLAATYTPPAPLPDAPDAPRVRIVQPNIGQASQFVPGHDERMVRSLIALSGTPGAVPRLVVWPEGAVNYFLEDGYPREYYFQAHPGRTRARVASVLGARDMLLLGGSALLFDPARRLTGAANSIFVIGPDGLIHGRYDKTHLVPYGEYLPAREWLEPLGLSRLVMGDIDYLPGPGPQSLSVPGFGRIAMQICYEIIFSGEVVDDGPRPALLFNPSNDAWFGSWGPPEHLAQARLRAIEEGVPIVRATPTGVSALIDANGYLRAVVPPHQAAAVEAAIPPAAPPTLFWRIGNWWVLLLPALLLAMAVAFRRYGR